MLIQFKTANHRSLRDEQVFSLMATDADADDVRLIRPAIGPGVLVPVAALYGANASGKSNLFAALDFAALAVRRSQRTWQPDQPPPRDAFSLGGAAGPSLYEFELILDGVRHQYGFALNDECIVEEWLYAWPAGRKQMLFTRDQQSFEFGRGLTGENRAIEGFTRPNSLFLSAAAQNNHPRLSTIYTWFSQRLQVVRLNDSWRPIGARSKWWQQFGPQQSLLPSRELRGRVLDLLATADLGIVDFLVEEDRPDEVSRPMTRRHLRFRHRGGDEGVPTAWLGLEQESTGTQALIEILPALLGILADGGVLLLDELNSLHPMLAVEIVRLFHDPARNPNRAQLVFNTHDTALLGNLLGEPLLRRDQIWFAEKDQAGATHIYPLTDYHPRQAENLERGYLQGRYGAVPFIGPLQWQGAGPEVEESKEK